MSLETLFGPDARTEGLTLVVPLANLQRVGLTGTEPPAIALALCLQFLAANPLPLIDGTGAQIVTVELPTLLTEPGEPAHDYALADSDGVALAVESGPALAAGGNQETASFRAEAQARYFSAESKPVQEYAFSFFVDA